MFLVTFVEADLTLYKGVIFDLDGTIVEHTLDYMAARHHIAELLSKHHVTFPHYETMRILEMVEKAEAQYASEGREREFETAKREALDVLSEYEREASEITRVLPNVVSTLESLRRRGLKLGLVTNNHSPIVEGVLERFELSRLFDAIVCRDDANAFKPSPKPLRLAVDRLGLRASEVLFVGDSVLDAESARRANIAFVGVLTGVSDMERFSEYRSKAVLSDLSELPSLIFEGDDSTGIGVDDQPQL